MNGKEMTMSKHIMLIVMGVVLAAGLCFALSAQTSKVYAAEGDVVVDSEGNRWEGTCNGLDWRIVETSEDGKELQLGKSGDTQVFEGNPSTGWSPHLYRNGGKADEPVHHTTASIEDDEFQAAIKARIPVIESGIAGIPWLAYRNEITSVKVMGDIIAKNSMAFMFCGLTNATSMTGLRRIDTTDVTDMSFVFGIMYGDGSGNETVYSCRKLTSLDVGSWKTENVESMMGMFLECRALTTLDISKFKTDKVLYMYAMFMRCTALTSLDLSHFNTSNVYDMGLMFRDCIALTDVDVSSFDTRNCDNTSGVFWNCRSLTKLDLSSWDVSRSCTFFGLFSQCYNLSEIKGIEDWNTSNVQSLQNTFSSCRALKTLDLSKWDTSNVESMNATFWGCENLESLVMLEFDTSKVTNADRMFYRANKIADSIQNEIDNHPEYSDETKNKLEAAKGAIGESAATELYDAEAMVVLNAATTAGKFLKADDDRKAADTAVTKARNAEN